MTTLELAREIAARSVPRAFLYFFRHRDRLNFLSVRFHVRLRCLPGHGNLTPVVPL